MKFLDTAETCFPVDDDLLNFTLEGEDREEEDLAIFKGTAVSSSSLETSSDAATVACGRGALGESLSEFVEEELEWLSNKDAFPTVETCFGILSDNPELVINHQSPVSVLENSTSSNISANSNSNGSSVASYCRSLKVPINYPVRARSKSRRRRSNFGHLPGEQALLPNQVNFKNKQETSFSLPPLPAVASGGAGMGRRCLHCQADKTPQWRAGPMGPKTLCNACGVRYKSGRLLPEYRPASSPTFSSVLHSNSHRKVVEMRRQKQQADEGGIPVNVGCVFSCSWQTRSMFRLHVHQSMGGRDDILLLKVNHFPEAVFCA